MTACDKRRILQRFVGIGRNFLRPRARQEAPIQVFDARLRQENGYVEALQQAGFRNPPDNPNRATQKFVELFGDFSLTNRGRIVFLQADGTDTEDDLRPTIEYDAAVEEVRDFPEMDDEYMRAVEEVRGFEEFAD